MYRYKHRANNKTYFLFDWMLNGCDPYKYFSGQYIASWSHVNDETLVIDEYCTNEEISQEILNLEGESNVQQLE